MFWIPAWLGRAYSELFVNFGENLFTFDQALSTLKVKKDKALLVLSLLRRKGYLAIFKIESRRRFYRLCDPATCVISYALGVSLRLRQERYRNLVLKTVRGIHEHYGNRLVSLDIFGSIARGNANTESDLDVFMIGEFDDPFASRIDELGLVEHSGILREELDWLAVQGVHCHISWFALRPEEAKNFRPVYLDLADDSIILIDRGKFLQKILVSVRNLMKRWGSQRVWLNRDKWYWVLKPSVRREEAVKV